MKSYGLLFLLSFFSIAIQAGPAGNNEAIVSQALAAFDNNYKASWAYKRTSIKNDRPAKVGVFDPGQPPANRWTLISIGDRAASTEEQAAWALRRRQEDEKSKNGLEEIISPDSLRLLEENETHWTFSFVPAPEGYADEDARRVISQVEGKLLVNKAGMYVEEILLSNDAPVQAATGVKLKLFEMRMSYGPVSDEGPVVPLSVETHIQGRSFFFVSFDDVKTVSFSDYVKVVADTE